MNSSALPSSPRVLVTGATGFIGRELMSAARSLDLRAALRRACVVAGAAESVIVGEIDGRTDWTSALEGIDSVVHLAARVHVMKPTASDVEQFERTNVIGTERLALAAAKTGVKRFVFLSSVKVNGETTEGRAFRADDQPGPLDDYGRSKLEAERRLLHVAAQSAMRIAIIRPPLVYGVGVGANFRRLLSWTARAAPLPLASIANARSMVSVWNLCDLIVSILRRPEGIGGTFMVSDGEDISTPDLIRRLAASMQRPTRLLPVPVGLLRAVGVLTGKSAELKRLCESLAVNIDDTRARLAWSPPMTLDQGLDRTAQWYLHETSAGRL